jgi:hypothetical protein
MKKLLLIFAGCSTSKISTSWNEHQQTPAHFNKILIVGLFDDNNRVLRQQMEEQLADKLRDEGYNVVTSSSLYGPKSFQKFIAEEALRGGVRSKDIDGVITIGLMDKNREKTYVPDYGYRPYGWAYRPLGPWGYMYRPYYVPGFRGHYETNVNYVFETNLYDVRGKQLVYSVQTKSVDPSNIYVLADDYSRSIIKRHKEEKYFRGIS